MDLQLSLLMPAMAALGIGLLIGLEREYGQRPVEGDTKHLEAAGIRTFALVALSGNLLTWLPETLKLWGISLGLAFTALIALISYFRTSKGEFADKGITSEIVLVMTFVLGALTGLGYMLPAIIIGVLVFSLLRLKKMLHSFSYSLSRMDLRQAMQFLIVTVVVLPILPDKTYGPYDALNPQHIWLMVVLICGIGFAAYAAIKRVGQRAGLGITGVLGGLVSSTAVTLAMSRLSRANPNIQASCLLAILVACATMFPRVLGLSMVFNPEIAIHLALPVALITIYTLAIAYWLWRKDSGEQKQTALYQPEINPLSLHIAIVFGAFYALIVFLAHMAQATVGEAGIMTVAGLSGLTDVDAITLSLSEMSREHLSAGLVAQAILLASAANTLVKFGIGAVIASKQTRIWLALGLLPMAAMSLVAALIPGFQESP